MEQKFKPALELMFMLIIAMTITACSKADDRHQHPAGMTGEQLFAAHCAGCHQGDGQGNFLLGVPANRNTSKNQIEIFLKIHEGDGGGMPVFRNMPPDEVMLIAQYVAEELSSQSRQ